MLTDEESHEGVRLDADSLNCIVTRIDTYAQRLGAFSERQEQELVEFRVEIAAMMDN